jgi:predicted O-linked N-acetylglucosamine transferase (SPINDLY family)
MEQAFDRFLDLAGVSTADMLARMATLDLDIAIDLNGHTNGAKLELFASRIAPVQLQYLGYPGTMGAEFFDYAIVDRFVVPESSQQSNYTEALVYLPDCYQVNDSERPRPESVLTKDDDHFTFCCFNASHKISPEIFAAWMRILRAVPDSVLWLTEDSEEGTRNLRAEARRLRIDADRLRFAPRVAMDEYLARHRLADLFLDTLPYNAHAGASDALWMGLPVLTCVGQSFAGRVAGSLLHAIGLPELVTTSMADYEALAVELGRNVPKLAAIKAKLEVHRLNTSLFNSEVFCKRFESALSQMWDRYRRGLKPESFTVIP